MWSASLLIWGAKGKAKYTRHRSRLLKGLLCVSMSSLAMPKGNKQLGGFYVLGYLGHVSKPTQAYQNSSKSYYMFYPQYKGRVVVWLSSKCSALRLKKQTNEKKSCTHNVHVCAHCNNKNGHIEIFSWSSTFNLIDWTCTSVHLCAHNWDCITASGSFWSCPGVHYTQSVSTSYSVSGSRR